MLLVRSGVWISYQDFSTANADFRIFAMIEIDAFLHSIPSTLSQLALAENTSQMGDASLKAS
jgi:hypothetical protein